MADLLNADPRGIVFGRSMTQLTMDLARTLAQGWGPGDEVVVTRLDHDSNVRSWTIAAERAGATVRWVDFDPATGELDAVTDALSDRTRVVAVTAASNLIGTRPDIPAIAAAAHDAGAMLHVDGVHYTAHAAARRRGARGRHLRVLAVQVPRASLRRPRRPAGGPRAAAPRQAPAAPATTSPSASSSAPPPTSCSPGPPRPSTSSPAWSRAPARAANGSSRRTPPSRRTRTGCGLGSRRR